MDVDVEDDGHGCRRRQDRDRRRGLLRRCSLKTWPKERNRHCCVICCISWLCNTCCAE
jgi:hypothetical protein